MGVLREMGVEDAVAGLGVEGVLGDVPGIRGVDEGVGRGVF